MEVSGGEMRRDVRGVVVAGTRSGGGKTLTACGLLAALKQKGLTPQGFKVGPDFIDPSHHARITGRDSPNLDGWMIGPEQSREIFARTTTDADIAVVEGVMGLFDGLRGDSDVGSTAEMAKILGLPVLLVVDAASAARSVAATVKGFTEFDPELRFVGVIFNRVASPAHGEMILQAMTALPHVPVLGLIQRRADLDLPSRHLGLHMGEESGWTAERIAGLAGLIAESVDLDRLLSRLTPLSLPEFEPEACPAPVCRIGVARDPAFCFSYAENLRRLRLAGAEIAEFSPLSDPALPADIDGLYLGGGYPELHAPALTANRLLRGAIRALSEAGAPILAECGGLMFLGEYLRDLQGREHPMTGVLPLTTVMTDRHAALGYRAVRTLAGSPLGPAGTVARGHEFHYSRPERVPDLPALFAVSGRKGDLPDAGYVRGGTIASYVHLHFASNPALAANFVAACAAFRARRLT